MRVVPSSPRVRRRLVWFGIALAVAGTAATIAVFVRSPRGPSSAPPKNAPPAQVVTRSTRVTPNERKAINKTLDQFIPAALRRSSPATAWRLAGPDLTNGSTLRQWRHGTSPIPYYPARGKTFHDWTTIDAGHGYVVFNLLVHSRPGSKAASAVFAGRMVKSRGRWLVDGLYTIAVMQRPTKTGQHELGPADFAAGQASSAAQSANGAALGKQWLALVAAIIGLVLLFPLGFGVASISRSRRRRKQYNRGRDSELPPLPSTVRPAERH